MIMKCLSLVYLQFLILLRSITNQPQTIRKFKPMKSPSTPRSPPPGRRGGRPPPLSAPWRCRWRMWATSSWCWWLVWQQAPLQLCTPWRCRVPSMCSPPSAHLYQAAKSFILFAKSIQEHWIITQGQSFHRDSPPRRLAPSICHENSLQSAHNQKSCNPGEFHTDCGADLVFHVE